MAIVPANTRKGRLRQLSSWAFWREVLWEALRELVFGRKSKANGQWIYHPHRETWEWREFPTAWYQMPDHP